MLREQVMTASVDGVYERRARVLPWGIEVEVWRLVETRTYPDTVANVSLRELLNLEGDLCSEAEVEMAPPLGRTP
jgi:hypothetical protein